MTKVETLRTRLKNKQDLLIHDCSMEALSNFVIKNSNKDSNWARIRSTINIMNDCLDAWKEFDTKSKQKRIQLIAIFQTFSLYQDAISELLGKKNFKKSN